MGSVLSGWSKWVFNERNAVTIVLIGLDGSGKSSITERFKTKLNMRISLDGIPPTIGINIGHYVFKKQDYVLVDTAGQASSREFWDIYSKNANVILYVIDAFDKARFPEALKSLEDFFARPLPCGLWWIGIILNKRDLLSGPEEQTQLLKEMCDACGKIISEAALGRASVVLLSTKKDSDLLLLAKLIHERSPDLHKLKMS